MRDLRLARILLFKHIEAFVEALVIFDGDSDEADDDDEEDEDVHELDDVGDVEELEINVLFKWPSADEPFNGASETLQFDIWFEFNEFGSFSAIESFAQWETASFNLQSIEEEVLPDKCSSPSDSSCVADGSWTA